MLYKKQFRLYDIYRKVTLKQSSAIKGVREYAVKLTDERIEIIVSFYDYEMYESCITISPDTEAKLKKFIKRVNKKLKNCRKPGPKAKNR